MYSRSTNKGWIRVGFADWKASKCAHWRKGTYENVAAAAYSSGETYLTFVEELKSIPRIQKLVKEAVTSSPSDFGAILRAIESRFSSDNCNFDRDVFEFFAKHGRYPDISYYTYHEPLPSRIARITGESEDRVNTTAKKLMNSLIVVYEPTEKEKRRDHWTTGQFPAGYLMRLKSMALQKMYRDLGGRQITVKLDRLPSENLYEYKERLGRARKAARDVEDARVAKEFRKKSNSEENEP